MNEKFNFVLSDDCDGIYGYKEVYEVMGGQNIYGRVYSDFRSYESADVFVSEICSADRRPWALSADELKQIAEFISRKEGARRVI